VNTKNYNKIQQIDFQDVIHLVQYIRNVLILEYSESPID